jgi:phospholipid/cholesterol/gamma-HCH transport system substrate-binding protein
MPSAAHVAWAKIRVASMIGCAIGILSVLIYLLLGGSEFLQPAVTIHTYMTDLSGLAKGSPVRFNGIKIGEVTSTEFSQLKDPQKVVKVDMAIVQRYLNTIPEDSTVAVAAETVLGDKFADINEGKSPQHIRSGAVLVTPPPKEINKADLIKAARDIVANTDAILRDIEAGRGRVGELVRGEALYDDSLKWLSNIQQQIRAATAKNTPVGKLIYDDTLYEQVRAPIKRLDAAMTELQAGRGSGGQVLKDPAQYDRVRKSVSALRQTLEDLNAGKGPTGQLLENDDLYVRMNGVVDQVNTAIDVLTSGEGALGHMMVNTSLYDNLQGSTRKLQEMLKDLRGNPKKFLRLKVF